MLAEREDRRSCVMIWRKMIPDRRKTQKINLEVTTNSVDSRNDKNARV